MKLNRVSAPGCDDAPVIDIPITHAPRSIQLIVPYYRNPLMLTKQVNHWMGLPEKVREALTVIIVDDGSPVQRLEPETLSFLKDRGIGVKAYRITVDVRWNWLAARNLAMSKAKDGWCLLTDIDHMVPDATFDTLLKGAFDEDTIYRFSRVEHGGETLKPHPNSWWMTKAMFWKVGGYDEALAGKYGTDGEYRRRCAKTAPIRIMTAPLVRWEFHLDSSTTAYARKQPEDRGVSALVKARGSDWAPKVLSFPYQELPL
jgi:glycosyl transferase family 2